MFTRSACKINGLQLTELKYEREPNGVARTTILYALAEGKESPANPGDFRLTSTHGKVTATGMNLSPATLALLKESIASVEADLMTRHFQLEDTEDTKEKNDETRTAAEGPELPDQI